MKRFLPYFLCCILVTSCASTEGPLKTTAHKETSPSVIFHDADTLLKNGQYKQAIKAFTKVETEFPYSTWAVKSKLLSAFAYYKDRKYDEAIFTLDNFIKLHPSNPQIDYAYYMRAQCYYEQISDVTRDQNMTLQAKQALREVIERFPDSKYSKDAKLKLDLVENNLAGQELTVGLYYLKRQHYSAAVNRFLNIVNYYQTTSYIEEALHRLVECYVALGLTEEAKKFAAILGHNYPKSKWYKHSYNVLNTSQ